MMPFFRDNRKDKAVNNTKRVGEGSRFCQMLCFFFYVQDKTKKLQAGHRTQIICLKESHDGGQFAGRD